MPLGVILLGAGMSTVKHKHKTIQFWLLPHWTSLFPYCIIVEALNCTL